MNCETCGDPLPEGASSRRRFCGRAKCYPSTYKPKGRRTMAERFWEKTVPGPNGCIDWAGSKLPSGYGRFSFGGKTGYAHHAALILSGRTPPIGSNKEIHTDHLCRRPCCVNPDHLEVVPSRVNAQRGRVARLTPEQVAEIRQRFAAEGGSKRSFGLRHAAEYGISPRSFDAVLSGVTWPNVPSERAAA